MGGRPPLRDAPPPAEAMPMCSLAHFEFIVTGVLVVVNVCAGVVGLGPLA